MQKVYPLKLIMINNQYQRQNLQRQEKKQRFESQQKFYQCSHLRKEGINIK